MKTHSMVTSLESLSEELLDRTFSFVDSSSDLALLARVSKSFNRIVSPSLYANPSFLHHRDVGFKHLRRFTFLMLQRPDLAALVQSFTVRPWYTTYHKADHPAWEQWPKHPEIHSVLKGAIEKHAVGEEISQKWLEVVQAGRNEAAIFALLLPILVNLRSMDVPFDHEYDGNDTGDDSEYILQMLLRAGEGQAEVDRRLIFGSLTDVMIPGTNDKYPDDPDWFAACVGLPAIKRIYGHNQGNEDQGANDPDFSTRVFSKLQPHSSPVEYIELRKSKLNVGNFAFLLRAPKSLKTMIYEIGNTWAWTDVRFPAIQSALEIQKDIEKLSLGHMPDYFPFMDGDDMTPISFSTLKSLKHLRVAPIFLYGQDTLWLSDGDGVREGPSPVQEELESTKMMLVDALPGQLETLGLINCHDPASLDRIVVSLREVLARKERFENLREVMVRGMKRETLSEKLTVFIALPWREKRVRLIVKGKAEVNYSKREYKDRPWGWDEDVQWGECINDRWMPDEVLYDSEVA